MKKLKSLVSALICTVMICAMLPINASAMEKGKKGTFFALIYKETSVTDNILKPYDLKSKDLIN